MSWWEWFQTGTGAITVVGVILGVVTWLQNRATNKLISHGDAGTQAILARMNELAEDRHREVIQAIQSLRG
jgi:hypothetical protein